MSFKSIITPVEKNLGGFSVRRLLPSVQQKTVGPWIFFDHMGPATFPAGEGINVRPHPHINLATVTYLFEGEILHRDSVGSVQPIRPGDLNLMVAGKGITHSERERDEVRALPHKAHGLQLWHALPEDQEEIDPAFYHYPADTMPSFEHEGVQLRLMMGQAYGQTSPVKTFAETLYLEARLTQGQTLPLPACEQLAVYVVDGAARVGDQTLPQYHLALFENTDASTLLETTQNTRQNTRLALIGGEAFPRRYIDWNFVSSRKERIEQAKRDWQEGKFPKVPGDEEEFIPLPG